MSVEQEIKESEMWFPNLTPARLAYKQVCNLQPINFENIMKGLDALGAYREQQIACLDVVEMKEGELNLILQRDLANLAEEQKVLESIGKPDQSGVIRDKAKSFNEANIIRERVTPTETTRYLRAQVSAMIKFLPIIAEYANRMEAFTYRRVAQWQVEIEATKASLVRQNSYACGQCGKRYISTSPLVNPLEWKCSTCGHTGFAKVVTS